jgi:hypothetical protein
MTIMTKEEVGAWCKEIADQINSDPILLDVFTRAYCTEEEEHMKTREELVKAVEDAMVAWHAADDGTTADWHFAAVAWDVAKAALADYDMVKRMNEEDQKKADEAAWSDARIACAAIRDADLDAAKNDIRAIDAAYSRYTFACIAIDDRWDAARAKREAWGV